MTYCDNLIIPYFLNNVDTHALTYLKETGKLKYDKYYTEKFWDFLKRDKCTDYIYLKDDKSFKYIEYGDGTLFDFIVTKIIKPVINNHLNVSDFMDTFYRYYVKDYIDKMANTVKNYTVECSSYESIIPPFETGWVKFYDTEYYANTIDLLTSIVLHKFTKYKFKIFDSSKLHCLNCRLFDLLMNSDYIISELTNKTCCDESYISYKSVKMFYNYVSNSKDFNQHISIHCKTAIEFVKKLVKYVFIEQFRQAIPHYLMRMRKYDVELNSIISDIELYYTKNLSILRKNHIYFNDIKESCKKAIEELSKFDSFDPYDYITDVNSILMSIIKFVPVEFSKDLKEIHTTINKDNSNISKEILIDSYKTLEKIILKLYVNSAEVLTNSYNFSFIKRWNELLKENTLWIPEDYFYKDKKFLTD